MQDTKLLEYLGAPLNKWKFGGDDLYYLSMRNSMKHSLKCELPEDVKNCYCGKSIDYNYYVYNGDTKSIKILCNSCCNRFIPYHMDRLRKFVGSDFNDWVWGRLNSFSPSWSLVGSLNSISNISINCCLFILILIPGNNCLGRPFWFELERGLLIGKSDSSFNPSISGSDKVSFLEFNRCN